MTFIARGARALAATVALVVPLALAACGSPANTGSTQKKVVAKDKPVRIAYFAAAESNAYAQAQWRGIKEVAAKMNGTARLFDGNFQSTTQYNQIQDATASGHYDAFVIDANDGNALVPAIQQAASRGITVIGAFVPIGPNLNTWKRQTDALTSTVGISFGQSGEGYGKLIVDACKGKDPCSVAYMPGDNTLPLETARTSGVKRIVSKHPNIKMTTNQQAGYLADTGLKTAQNVLQANRHVDVMASNDQAIRGATQAVRQAGLLGKVKLIGGGGSKQAIAEIRKGTWFGDVMNVPYSEGKEAAKRAIEAARGQKVPVETNSMDLSPVGLTVTKANLGDYQGEWTS